MIQTLQVSFESGHMNNLGWESVTLFLKPLLDIYVQITGNSLKALSKTTHVNMLRAVA